MEQLLVYLVYAAPAVFAGALAFLFALFCKSQKQQQPRRSKTTSFVYGDLEECDPAAKTLAVFDQQQTAEVEAGAVQALIRAHESGVKVGKKECAKTCKVILTNAKKARRNGLLTGIAITQAVCAVLVVVAAKIFLGW